LILELVIVGVKLSVERLVSRVDIDKFFFKDFIFLVLISSFLVSKSEFIFSLLWSLLVVKDVSFLTLDDFAFIGSTSDFRFNLLRIP